MKSYFLRRRNYLINKDFQFRYIAKILFGIVIMALIIALTIYYTTWSRIMDAFHHLPEIAAQFAPLFSSVNQSLIIMVIVFMLAAAVASVFISHSIAGPMFRIEKSIETITRGDLTLCVGLRKNDEFRYLADKMNLMTESLIDKVKMERNGLDDLAEKVEQLQKACGRNEQTLPELKALVEKVDQLQQQHKDRFKLPG